MKNHTKITISALMLILMLPMMLMIPASANSRAQEWYGRDANGVVFVGDDIPIEVTNELLSFDIPTLPYATYNNAETFLSYDSRVTAEYTFYNPTDMTITATLLFPFGSFPEYGRGYDSIDKYGVMMNGEKINATLRHTPYTGKFNAEEDASILQYEYVSDDFYHPDLTVTKYTYEVGGSQAASESFQIRISGLNENQLPVNYQGNLGSYIESGTGDFILVHTTTRIGETKIVHFYIFGEPLKELPTVSWKKANGPDPSTEVDRYVEFLGKETTTLKEFIQNERTYDKVSDIDWYNSCVAKFKSSEEGGAKGHRAIRFLSLGALMRWYEYEITINPGESITNTVTAPMYPVISAWNRPITYEYTYLLSPASNWASFGKLDIVINTPYEMINCNIEGFEKTESGYRLTREGLPTNEDGVTDLYFTLENDGNTPLNQPKVSNKSSGFFAKISNFFSRIFNQLVDFFSGLFNLNK